VAKIRALFAPFIGLRLQLWPTSPPDAIGKASWGSFPGLNVRAGDVRQDYQRPKGRFSAPMAGVDMKPATSNFLNLQKNASLMLFASKTYTTDPNFFNG
jgi:hypothetical protein